jgi:hypothetical protein
MICERCGAVYRDGGQCWNCSPAYAVNEDQVPKITRTLDDLPTGIREHIIKAVQV